MKQCINATSMMAVSQREVSWYSSTAAKKLWLHEAHELRNYGLGEGVSCIAAKYAYFGQMDIRDVKAIIQGNSCFRHSPKRLHLVMWGQLIWPDIRSMSGFVFFSQFQFHFIQKLQLERNWVPGFHVTMKLQLRFLKFYWQIKTAVPVFRIFWRY